MDQLDQQTFDAEFVPLLAELTALDGLAGHEQPVVRRLAELLSPHADRLTVDHMGNLYATRTGRGPGPTVMIVPHCDEIGLVVRHVEPGGFLRVERVGGVSEAWLPGTRVRVAGHLGVVGVKAGHFQTEEDRRRVSSLDELYVDVGASGAEEVAALGIGVGSPVVPAAELAVFSGGRRVTGKALDNRIGCALLVMLFRHLAAPDLAGTLVGVVAVQEEVGLRGAQVSAFRVKPDYALAVDTIPCGGTPDVPVTASPAVIGRGPVIPLAAHSLVQRFFIHPGVRAMLEGLAAAEGIPCQPAVFRGVSNDSAAIAQAGEGVPAGSVCIPRRYSHSPAETADLGDCYHAFRLLEAVVRTNGPDRRFDFLAGGTN